MTIPLHSWVARGGGGKAGTTGPVLPTGPTLPPTGVEITDPAVIGPQGELLVMDSNTGFGAIAVSDHPTTPRIIAVGGQLGAASGGDPGPGGPATSPGAKESRDGGASWIPMPLPLTGTKVRFNVVAFHRERDTGRAIWYAASKYLDGGSPVCGQYFALDTQEDGGSFQPLSWVELPPLPRGNSIEGAVSTQLGLCMFGTGSLGPIVRFWPDLSAVASITDENTARLNSAALAAGVLPRGASVNPDLRGVNLYLQFGVASWLDGFATPGIGTAAAITSPWGTSGTNCSYVYAAATEERGVVIVLVSQPYNPTAWPPGKANPPGRRLFTGSVGTANIASWAGWREIAAPLALRDSSGNESYQAVHYDPVSRRWAAIGFDRDTFKSVCAIAPLVNLVSQSQFTEYRIPESNAWTGVTSAKGKFVACSLDGHLLVLK